MENNGVKYGLLAGLGVIAYSLILYLIDDQMLFGWASSIGTVIYLICMYKAGVDERQAAGGFITWKEALTPTFLTYVIASLIATVFTYLLFTTIDPGLMDIQREMAIQQIQGMEGMIGEEGVEEGIKRIEEQGSMNLRDTSLGFAMMLIVGFVFAAIISAIVKRNRPAGV
ncbi:MAG: DUF4199 domain-containing protein [Saprospiraceae bacterium]